jgi:protein O-mannosyl-transferase
MQTINASEQLCEGFFSKKTFILGILIICTCSAVLITHWPALSAQALYFDDDQYLVRNTLVKNPSWDSAWKFLSQVLEPSTVEGYYQPLMMISLMFDYSLGGRVDNLLHFHLTSLILHAANTALVIVLLYLLFGNVWGAGAAGLLFGLHPMTVETIPWVGERKTLLAAFFTFWSILFYLRYTHSHDVTVAKNSIIERIGKLSPALGTYIACFLFYFLALMSKPTSTPLPLLMLLLDFWPLKRLRRAVIIEKIPFFIFGGIFAVITYISQTRASGSILPAETGFCRILLILCHNIIFYLYKIVWPVNLFPDYQFPNPLNLSQPTILVGVIGTCILIPLLLLSLRWTRAAFTSWLFFFIAILPTMQIIGFSTVIASDKFAYIPSFGLLMFLTFILCRYNILQRKRWPKIIIAILVLSVASVESIATRRYLVHWNNSFDLYTYVLSKAPNDAALHHNIGRVYERLDRWQDAIESYKQAIKLRPNYALAYYNLGITYGKLDRYQDAIESYKQAIRIKPDFVEAYYNLGNAYGKLGQDQNAIEPYKEAIKINPDFALAHYNLGFTYGNLGRWQDAIESYKQAIRIKPDFAAAHFGLGISYLRLGDKVSAFEEYKILKTLDVERANNLFNLIYEQ